MQIDIQCREFSHIAQLLDHTRQRLRFALTRNANRIRRVVVRLGDVSGAGGKDDKFCRMQVYLEHAPPILIEDTGADMYAVIDRAAERAGRTVAKNFNRLQKGACVETPRRPISMSDDDFDVSKN